MTFYEILGVPRSASQDEIRSAYRELARRYHPDRLNGSDQDEQEQAEEYIKAINAAYQTLGDPRRRAAYHSVMWSIHDPALQFRVRPKNPETPAPRPKSSNGKGPLPTQPSSDEAQELYLEMLRVKAEKENLSERHAIHRRRLWMSAGFTSLIVYFLIALGIQIYTDVETLLSIGMYFLGVELITLSIILNASGVKLLRFPFAGNPISFSITVTLGTIVTCSSIPNFEPDLSAPGTLYSGMVISSALLIHLFLATRLARIQELDFETRFRQVDDRLAELKELFQKLKRKG